MKQEYKDLKIKYSELQQSLQESLQGHHLNGNMLIMPSLEWVTNPTNGKQKYKYIPKPRSNSNNFKPGCMDNQWNDLYNSPCPKGGQTVAQGYYTQTDKQYDSDESDPDNWDGGYFPPRDDDEQFGDADYHEY